MVKFNNSVLICWGKLSGRNTISIVFPIAFINHCSLATTTRDISNYTWCLSFENLNLTGVQFAMVQVTNGQQGSITGSYICIGY